jgi:eukaryotic-like serine/threonine-protein kinase
MIGKTFAHYVILEKAGAGGMGVVYRAHDEKLHRDVALKLPTMDDLTNEEARSRILREARAASALNHPNICTIYEVGEVNGQPYIAMEYVPGETLSKRIPAEGLPTEAVLDFGAQIADALEHAHTQGILHRDLKSPNVRATAAGQLKVLDFGLAMSIKDSAFEGVTRTTNLDTGEAAGTLAYMAPELLKGKISDVRTDVWSLGVVLYELAAGTLPFHGGTSFELSTAILREPPAALPTHVTPGLRAVITRCLAKEPEKRYQRASEVRAAMEALQSDTGVTSRVDLSPSRKHIPWYLLAGVSLLAIGAVVLLVSGRFGKPVNGPRTGGKLRLFVSSEGNLSGPTLSPDGKMVAYIQETNGRDDLYVSRVAGGEHVRLTNDGSQKEDPQFSPDGEKIVFVRRAANAPEAELCLVPALGGNIVPLVSGASLPTWSPDGSRLAFILGKQGDAGALATSAADGSDVRVILKSDDVYPFFGRVSWSPDGALLAVSRSRGGMNREIWTVPSQGGGTATRLTKDQQGVVSDMPVFAADGRGIIHRSNRGGASNLWWQPLDGKSSVQLTTGPGPDTYPSVARNGTIAFLNSRSRNLLLLYSLSDGASTTLLTDASRFWAPAFSPDGKEIAYSRDQPDGSWHLWMVPASGGDARQLTSGKVPEVYARFTPDGSAVYFNTWGGEPLSIWRVPSEGGPARPATSPSAGSDAYADVSPDGRLVAFTRTENKVSHIYVAATDGSGQPRRLVDTSSTIARWSPEGKWISFSPNRGFSSGVFIVHPDGTGLRRLTENGGWAVWWPDGEQIGFQVVGSDGNQQIQVLSLKTGATRTLPNLHFIGTNFPFDISRDGKWLVTTNFQHISDEIWLLEPAEKK